MSADPLDHLYYVLDHLHGKEEEKPGKYLAFCPAHGDTHPSLAISVGDNGKVVLTCRSQRCDIAAILAAAQLTKRDLIPFDQRDANNNGTYQQPRALRPTGAPPTKATRPKIPKAAPNEAVFPPVAEYEYTDENGAPLYYSLRCDVKGKPGERPFAWRQAATRALEAVLI